MELVVGASDATMKSLLGKLGGLLAQEYTLIRGVRGDIQYITDELATMQAFLGDVGSTQEDHDLRIKNWMKQIRDMAYDMEDCIDDFAHRLPHDPLSDTTCSFIVTRIYELRTFWPRRQIASKIAELKVRAQHIAERRGRYGVDNPGKKDGSSPGAGATHALTSGIGEHLMPNCQLIHTLNPEGVDEDMKELKTWMENEDKHSDPAVLSIVGFGGVGKTTIATKLYRDFGKEFDCRALVTVSQYYDEDQVLMDILGQIKPRDGYEEQQDRNTGVPAGKNLAAGTKEGLVKRLVPLLSGRREQGNDGSTHGGDQLIEVKPRDSKQEQQDRNTGTPAEKNLAAGIKPGLAKRLVPLFRGHSKQGNDGGTQWTQSKIDNMNRDQLIEELRSRLQGKRYILLIDDIWSVETWENIRNWLPHEKDSKGSKVIVTSRFQAVGAACSGRDGTDRLHTVNVLSEPKSKSLFDQGVSESQSNGSEKEKVHEEIWKYCGGLPLAIVTMAGLVACKDQSKTNDHYSKLNKLFPEQVARLTLEDVTKILDYCFNDLPADLKTCSLYLSIFPKGSKISKKRLTRRWISESFVTEKQGKSAEEVAEIYFNQLIRRKIIRPVDHSSNGNVKSFKVHDMILEYIVSKSSEENFITVVGGHWMMPTPSNKVRRLSMQSSGSKDWNSTKGMNLSQVRSLTVFGSQNGRLTFHSFNNRIIQVLDLEGWKGMKDKYLNDICKMLVLKYLSLRRTEVHEIPSKIEKLQYLETLDIRETRVEVLPRAFGQLKRLRSLLGGSKNPKKALKLPLEKNKEPMKALRVLSGIEINKDSAAIASLHQLTGLKKLAIYKLNIQEGDQLFKQLLSSIEYLSSCGLQILAINDEGSDFINKLDSMSTPPRYLVGLELSGKMEKPPEWIKKLENLYKLTLSVTVLRTDTFPLIKNLPKLFSLTFTLTAGKDDRDIVDILEENKLLTNREIIVPPGGFESLKLLRFFATLVPRLSFAVTLTEKDVMPALERIDMRFQSFEGIYGIETLKSLQELHLSVGNQADEVTKFLVEELKDSPKYLDKEYASKWPKIISD